MITSVVMTKSRSSVSRPPFFWRVWHQRGAKLRPFRRHLLSTFENALLHLLPVQDPPCCCCILELTSGTAVATTTALLLIIRWTPFQTKHCNSSLSIFPQKNSLWSPLFPRRGPLWPPLIISVRPLSPLFQLLEEEWT